MVLEDAGLRRNLHAKYHAPRETPTSIPAMKSKNLRRTLVPNNPTTKAVAIKPDDPHSMSQLLRLLEGQLDKHIDDCRYVTTITVECDGLDLRWPGIISTAV